MIDADFITTLRDELQTRAVKVNGKEYTTAPVHNAPLPDEPDYPTVSLLSLDSFADFVKANLNVGGFINCSFAGGVSYLSVERGENRQRDVFASAAPGVSQFRFDQFMPLEDFRIGLLTQFENTPQRAQTLSFIARITDQNVKTSEDDGVSQLVTVKAGIASYGEASVPSPLTLRPIRTFIEVEQPEGLFLLRLKPIKDQLPQAALFEIHTNWKRAAAVAIKQYLDAAEVGVPVYA